MQRFMCTPGIITDKSVSDSSHLMAPCSLGPWVRYVDYLKVEQELARYKTPNVDDMEVVNDDPIK